MNKTDYRKLLAELSEDLRKSTVDLKQELVNIKSLHTRARTYVDDSKTLIDKITNGETGIEKVLSNSQEIEVRISELKDNAENNLNSITTNLDLIKTHTAEIETAYVNFTNINNKITNEETGLAKILANAQAFESKIIELKNNSETHLQTITDKLAGIQSHLTKIEGIYASFADISNKITNEETGLNKILSDSESLKSDIEATKSTSETIFKEISQLKDAASGHVTDLKKSAEAAKKTVELIIKNHEESESLKDKINDIFNISSQNAHANYFDDRQKKVFWIALFWFILSILFLILIAFLGERYILPLVKFIESGESDIAKVITVETIIIRAGLIAPSIFAFVYCLKQYGQERRLHEKYAFKAISMLSIESSVELVNRSLQKVSNVDDRDIKLTHLTINTFESIYKDPIEANTQSWLFKIGNKILEGSAELRESVGELKEIVRTSKNKSKKSVE